MKYKYTLLFLLLIMLPGIAIGQHFKDSIDNKRFIADSMHADWAYEMYMKHPQRDLRIDSIINDSSMKIIRRFPSTSNYRYTFKRMAPGYENVTLEDLGVHEFNVDSLRRVMDTAREKKVITTHGEHKVILKPKLPS